jgi:hypothetical protein
VRWVRKVRVPKDPSKWPVNQAEIIGQGFRCCATLVLAAALSCERRGTAPPTSAAAPDTKATAIEIAVVGDYLPYDSTRMDERNPAWWRSRNDDRWLALCQRQGRVEFVPTKMVVSPAEGDGNKDGLLASAPGCPDAIALVRGLAASGSEIPTAQVTHTSAPSSREQDTTWDFELLGRTAHLYFRDAEGLPLMLRAGNREQEIRNWKDVAALAESDSSRHDWGFAGSVNVLWAGDLNHDGQLDLLLKQGDAELGTSIELYLSNGSATEPRVSLVDRFAIAGC